MQERLDFILAEKVIQSKLGYPDTVKRNFYYHMVTFEGNTQIPVCSLY